MAWFGVTDRVQTARIPQKESTKNSAIVTAPWIAEAVTMVWRQSLARSAMRPMVRLSAIITSTGATLITAICRGSRPFSANQMPAPTTEAPSGVIRRK